MARTNDEIKKEITDRFLSDETLMNAYGVDVTTNTKTWNELFSKTSLTNMIVNIVSATAYLLETIFDTHKAEVDETINNRAHTLRWYRNKALAFQYGCDLAEDVAEYDNSELTDEEVEETKIVKKCSCTSADTTFPTILVKVSKDDDTLTDEELVSFTAYMNEIADAGIRITTRSKSPDKLALKMTIWYDPLVLDTSGHKFTDTSVSVVKEAVDEYLDNLEYNGAFYPKLLEQYLMKQEGIKIAKVELAGAIYGDDEQFVTIDNVYMPYSGALTYEPDYSTDFTVSYINFENTYRNV